MQPTLLWATTVVALALNLLPAAFAQEANYTDNPLPVVINTPNSMAQCEPTLLSWSGGNPPYHITVIPGGKAKSKPLRDFEPVNTTSMTWTCNEAEGTYIGLKIVDGWGNMNWSGAMKVQAGANNDSSCVVPDPPMDDGGMSKTTKIIIGASVGGGGVVVLAALCALFALFRRRRAAKKNGLIDEKKASISLGRDDEPSIASNGGSSPTKSSPTKSTAASDDASHLPAITYKQPPMPSDMSALHVAQDGGLEAPQPAANRDTKVTYQSTSVRPVSPRDADDIAHGRTFSDDSGVIHNDPNGAGFRLLSDVDENEHSRTDSDHESNAPELSGSPTPKGKARYQPPMP